MPGIPGRGDPTACRTPGSGWAPRRRRPSGDNWAAGNLWAGAQLWRPLLFQSGARESVSGLSGMSGEAPPPPTLREERQIRNRDQGKTSGAPPLRPSCLTEIERLTFKSSQCLSLAKKIVTATNATLNSHCPGHSGIQINNTQAMKKRKKREVTTNKCLKQVSNLIELWRYFSRSQ
uniref:Thymic stromal lymphopoietin n=1 Tax=Equus caballus TaxID=9796 RepID=A0A9L0SQ63_HORSE